MTDIDRYLEFKSSWGRYVDNHDGTYYTARPRIKFTGDFSGTRFVISNINIDRRYDEGGRYLDTEANPGTPYAPQYPGSPATKKYVDDNIPTNVSDLTNDSNFQTATQVNQAISTAVSSAYKYKGSVANQAALPASGNITGDVWNTEDTGMNYAWTGSAWDALGTIVDLSGKQDKLIAGSNIQIASDGKTISATDTKYTAGNGINIDSNNEISANTTVLATKTDLNSKQDTISDLAAIRSGAGLGATAVQPGDNISDLTNDSGFITNSYHDSTKQDTLIAGSNIQIASDGKTISATDTTYTAGDNIQISSSNVINATDTKYTAGNGINIDSNNEISANTTVLATKTDLNNKQDTLVSGTNIKTVNNESLLGTGNITISAPTYTAGDNVQISSNNVISATDTTYNAGTGIAISQNNQISNTLPGAVVSGTAPFNPSQGDMWYDTTEDTLNTYDGEEWNGVGGGGGGGDVLVSDQPNNILTSGMKIWAGEETDYQNLSQHDSNTLYLTIE